MRNLRNSFMVMKLVRGMKITLRLMKTKLRIMIVTCLPEWVSWSCSAATRFTSCGIITELKRIRIRGAKYSGRKFLKVEALSTSSLSHCAIGFVKSKSYKKWVRVVEGLTVRGETRSTQMTKSRR